MAGTAERANMWHRGCNTQGIAVDQTQVPSVQQSQECHILSEPSRPESNTSWSYLPGPFTLEAQRHSVSVNLLTLAQ